MKKQARNRKITPTTASETLPDMFFQNIFYLLVEDHFSGKVTDYEFFYENLLDGIGRF